ncbi:MAG TPA: peptidoglycan-binding domain-containing protein [Micromonosporaceae bacterium]|nr:peptidoglycan-binding domain-containing protein [Micromonosporaceae bacterium]
MSTKLRTGLGAGVAVLVVGAAAAAAVGFGGTDTPAPAGAHLPPATAKVTRATLTQTENVTGTLGYGDTYQVTSRAGAGTLTWLAPIGSTVTRGKPLFKVDDRPAVLLYGSTPLYRPLQSGETGADVAQLEQNLKALGYSGFTVDDEFSASTATAVKAWQADLGLDQTGTVTAGQVVVAAGPLRVAEQSGTVGGSANGPVLAYTNTTRIVTVALDVAKQHLVRKGISATVTLPDGKTVTGTVTSVGTVATRSTTGQGAQQSSTTTIAVTVSIADQTALGTLDEAPVDVTLVADQRKDVLTVPVAALVALAEGGYGVQGVEGSTTRYVAVTTGMFAGGRVEISGNGISTDTTVGVPR